MTARLFARLGVEAVLRAGEPIRVLHSTGVAIVGESGVLLAYRDVAEIPSEYVPRLGDALLIGGKDYVIDTVEANDGYTVRCILREREQQP